MSVEGLRIQYCCTRRQLQPSSFPVVQMYGAQNVAEEFSVPPWTVAFKAASLVPRQGRAQSSFRVRQCVASGKGLNSACMGTLWAGVTVLLMWHEGACMQAVVR